VLLGEASYSVYLLHNALLSAAARTLRAIGLNEIVTGWPAFALLALIAIAGGVAFHLVCEAPVMRFLRTLPERGFRWTLRRRAPS